MAYQSQATPPFGRGRDGQPPWLMKDRHTGQGRPLGPVRDRPPHTRQLHNEAGETLADRRESAEF